jgi:glycosyltransferase involved in cell wall biosynthesis
MANALLPSSENAGVPFQVDGLANALQKRGHEVTVFSQSVRPHGRDYSVRTFRSKIPLRRGLRPFAQALFLAATDLSGFDVVHAHGDNYLLLGSDRQVRTFHGSAKDELRNATRRALRAYYGTMIPLENLGARVASWNVAVSRATTVSIPRIDEVIPCGVDLSRFGPGEKSREPSILFIGTLEGRKRGRLLVECFSRFIRPLLPEAELWLVSNDSVDLPGVKCCGKVTNDELARLYSSAWVLCMPSAYEGFGVPLIEAMASGTAVVSSPNPGANEVLDDGRYGEIAVDSDLSDALIGLLTNSARRLALRDRGLKEARRYDWDLVAASYEAAYSRVSSHPLNIVQRLTRRVS